MHWVKKHAIELMNLCALVGALLTVMYAHWQLQHSRQVSALTSLLTLKSDVVESRRSVRDFLVAGVDREKAPSRRELLAFRLDLLDYLLTIEYSCTLYLNGVLSKEAVRFLKDEITGDLELLGDTDPMFGFYEDGNLVLSDDISVEWVDRNDREASSHYPNTLKCAESLGVKIGAPSVGTGL